MFSFFIPSPTACESPQCVFLSFLFFGGCFSKFLYMSWTCRNMFYQYFKNAFCFFFQVWNIVWSSLIDKPNQCLFSHTCALARQLLFSCFGSGDQKYMVLIPPAGSKAQLYASCIYKSRKTLKKYLKAKTNVRLDNLRLKKTFHFYPSCLYRRVIQR